MNEYIFDQDIILFIGKTIWRTVLAVGIQVRGDYNSLDKRWFGLKLYRPMRLDLGTFFNNFAPVT